MIPAEKIIVALDTHDEKQLQHLFTCLQGQKVWVKIGMEAFYSIGPQVIHLAKDKGFKVFLDLKLHDIPNTVSEALKALARLPIDMVNVHAAGGKEMMLRASEALDEMPHRPLLIAVTQLTSTTQTQMNNDQRIQGKIEDSVIHYATMAKFSKLDGVVSSPLEVKTIKDQLGKNFLTITPGIRPLGNELNDQKRVTTPKEAFELGTDFMVIGRPITAHQDPKAALLSIIEGN